MHDRTPVASYADRALDLDDGHGLDCPCFICADIRKAHGFRPVETEHARIARLMHQRAAGVIELREMAS